MLKPKSEIYLIIKVWHYGQLYVFNTIVQTVKVAVRFAIYGAFHRKEFANMIIHDIDDGTSIIIVTMQKVKIKRVYSLLPLL